MTNPTPQVERQERETEALKALTCLYIAVDESVADDVNQKVRALIDHHAQALREAQAATIPCHTCGKPATCYGSYEGPDNFGAGCDECCGHGNEDGWCKPIAELPADYRHESQQAREAQEEIGRLKTKLRQHEGCPACSEFHDEGTMCPPHEVRSTGFTKLEKIMRHRDQLAQRAQELEVRVRETEHTEELLRRMIHNFADATERADRLQGEVDALKTKYDELHDQRCIEARHSDKQATQLAELRVENERLSDHIGSIEQQIRDWWKELGGDGLVSFGKLYESVQAENAALRAEIGKLKGEA